MKRLFIAIEVPQSIKQLASGAKELLEGKTPNARWVPSGNVHLTLRFLGDCGDELVPKIVDAMSDSLRTCHTFHSHTTGLGAFPNPKRPAVLWLGVKNEPGLIGVYKEMNKALVSLGFDAEKRAFRPHITLARIKAPRPIDINITGSRISFERDFFVEGVTLFQSHLSREGALHEVVAKIKLAGSA